MPTAENNTVNSNVIGIQAGNAKCGLPPIFNGQSFVKIQLIKVSAVVVPVMRINKTCCMQTCFSQAHCMIQTMNRKWCIHIMDFITCLRTFFTAGNNTSSSSKQPTTNFLICHISFKFS